MRRPSFKKKGGNKKKSRVGSPNGECDRWRRSASSAFEPVLPGGAGLRGNGSRRCVCAGATAASGRLRGRGREGRPTGGGATRRGRGGGGAGHGGGGAMMASARGTCTCSPVSAATVLRALALGCGWRRRRSPGRARVRARRAISWCRRGGHVGGARTRRACAPEETSRAAAQTPRGAAVDRHAGGRCGWRGSRSSSVDSCCCC